ncbi:MAG: MFS transporter [Spirochaetota bacterium]
MRSGITIHLRRLVLPVYVPVALLSLGVSAPVAGFPQYLGGLGAAVAVVGVVIAMRGVGNLLGDMPSGLVLGRWRLRSVVFTALVAAGVTSAAMATVRSVVVIGVLVLLTGAMTSVVVTAMMTYVRMTVPASVRGRALSLTGGAVRVGALVGPIAGGLLADIWNVPAAIGLRAVCFFVAAAAFALSPDRGVGAPGPSAGAMPSIAKQLRAIGRGLRGRGYALATVGFAILMLQLLRTSRTIVLPLWGDGLGLSTILIGSVMSVGAALELVLFVPSGIIMDHAGRKVAAGLCIGIFAIGMLWLSMAKGLPGFIVASILIGIGNGFGSGINMTIGTDLAPSGAVSEFLGVWRLFGDVGSSAGPAIVGTIATAGGLPLAVVATAALGFLGLVSLAFAPEPMHLSERE